MIAGCAGDANEGLDGATAVDYDALRSVEADVLDALCRSSMLCGDQGFLGFFQSACHPRTLEGSFETAKGWIEAGLVVFDRDRAAQCHAAYVSPNTCEEVRALDLDECLHVLAGTVPIGGACTDGDQCVPGATCRSDGESCSGQCEAKAASVFVEEAMFGERCEDRACAGDLKCTRLTSGAEICAVGRVVGDACDAWTPCGPGGLCAGDTCKRAALPNDACDDRAVCPDDFECRSGRCEALPREPPKHLCP